LSLLIWIAGSGPAMTIVVGESLALVRRHNGGWADLRAARMLG
jgi:hypothetical protein